MRDREHLLSTMTKQLRPVLWHIGVVSLFINLLILPVSLYSLQVFDRVMATGSLSTLLWLTIMMVILFIVAGFLQAMRGIMLQRTGDWTYDEIAKTVLPLTLSQAAQSGTKGAQGLRDATALKHFIGGPGLVTLMDAPWSVLYLTVLFIVHPLLGTLATVGALSLLMLAWLNEVMTRKPSGEAGGRQMQSIQELEFATRNAEVIEAMGMSGTLINRWQELQEKIGDMNDQASGRASMIQGITKFVRLTLQVLVTGIAAWLALKGSLTLGAIIAASILASRALAPFESAIASWKGLSDSKHAYRRLEDMLNNQLREQTVSLPRPAGHLSVEGLVYIAPSKQAILKKVSFALQAGESVGIVGHSGAGKSTLARLIMGVWKPTGGIVRLDSADVYTWPRHEFGQYVGYLPQDVELFSGTVKANIARMQEDADTDAIIEAAQLANAHELILRLPNGYDTEIGTGGSSLSAGQRQRIGLARAFYGNPSLLVLDEPDANLDETGTQALLIALKQAKLKKMTVVVITHRKPLLAHVEKMLVMNQGNVEAFGPTKQVVAKLNEARRVTGEQPS